MEKACEMKNSEKEEMDLRILKLDHFLRGKLKVHPKASFESEKEAEVIFPKWSR